MTGRSVEAIAIDPLVAPMEARSADALPEGPGWQYEPKWDGFRAIAAFDGPSLRLTSKSGKSLGRYFPEVVAMLESVGEDGFVVDGELTIAIDGQLSFDALQARLHPAASRVERLARETPAQFILFDCLEVRGRPMIDASLIERRAALVSLHSRIGKAGLLLSPETRDIHVARAWLHASGGALDGVIAKALDQPYRPGERAMIKVKQLRTADCVVGGYRENERGEVASLLLGLYDKAGKLDHVGFTASFSAADRKKLSPLMKAHRGAPGFTGDAPGGPSRWNGGKASPWNALDGSLVAEVIYDQVTNGRFRHGTRFHRWRPDKAPHQCTREQLIHALRPSELIDLVDRQG